MSITAITDPLFQQALAAIDASDLPALQTLLSQHPGLVSQRLDTPLEGYFRRPFLLWFIADNPIRTGTWPQGILDSTAAIIAAAHDHAPGSFQFQLDYTLDLVASGSTARNSGKQLELMDLLINAGAIPNNGLSALAHGNFAAAAKLLERGASLSLAIAVALERTNDIPTLLQKAQAEELELAITVAAFSGQTSILEFLIQPGIDLDAFPSAECGFHSHATALHHAVSACAPETVRLLITAGASPDIIDLIYQGTPLDWAIHYHRAGEEDEVKKQKWAEIITYLEGLKNK